MTSERKDNMRDDQKAIGYLKDEKDVMKGKIKELTEFSHDLEKIIQKQKADMETSAQAIRDL